MWKKITCKNGQRFRFPNAGNLCYIQINYSLYEIRDRYATRGTIRPGGSSACFSVLAQ